MRIRQSITMTASNTATQTFAASTAAKKSGKKVMEKIRLVVLQILLTILLITFLIPALWMVSSSLKASTEVFVHPIVWIPETPQWQNFIKVFEILPFATFAWNTFLVVVLAVAGTLFSSVLVGYGFARLHFPGRDVIFSLLIASLMLPEVIVLVPRFIIFRWLGWIDTLLPLIIPYWFGTTPWTPLYIFLMRQFFRGIPVELEEAARIDGAGYVRTLIQIILPLSKPVIATVAVFATLQHYTDFMQPLIYLSTTKNWTMAVGIAGLNAHESYSASWELVFAAGTLMTVPMILLFIFAQRYFVQGIVMTGFGGR